MKLHQWIRATLVFGALIFVATAETSFSGTDGAAKWRPLRIGAGGFVTGIDISPDGSTRLVRTDTYGAYIWDFGLDEWRQIVLSASMPKSEVGVDKNSGVYEIRVAPSLPNRIYMAYRGNVYRSDNRGKHWTLTAFANVQMDANDNYRTAGQKMAVDPVNPDVVFVGTAANGIFMTSDGGAKWDPVGDIPKSRQGANGQYPGHAGIVFDGSSSATNGRTNTLYASSYGNGVYRSADGGASWTRLSGGPASVSHAKLATDGAYYAVGDESQSVWRYDSGAWTNITPSARNWATIVTDPNDPARIIATEQGGRLQISHDRGATWSAFCGSGCIRRVATDIPWLQWTNETYMSAGDMLFDPALADRLWFAEGIGVWFADVPNRPAAAASVVFRSRSKGIEQLVANEVISPPGGRPGSGFVGQAGLLRC